MRASVPATPSGAGGSAAGSSGSQGPPSAAASQAPSAESLRSGSDDPHDSVGDAALALAVGSHWDGVLQRQAAVSAYTPAHDHSIVAAGGDGDDPVGEAGGGEAGSSAAASMEAAAAHARDMFSLIAGELWLLGSGGDAKGAALPPP